MHTVFAAACTTGRSDDNKGIWLSLSPGIDTLCKFQEASRSLIYFSLAHLDLYGSPTTTGQGNQCINLIAGFVSPGIDTTAESLSIDA